MKLSVQIRLFFPLLPIAAWALFFSAPAVAVPLFEEDFEGVSLGANVDETVPGDMVWTDKPPPGWTVDNSAVPGIDQPGIGVTEWKGWTFADRTWWASVDDQLRSEFVGASGTIAIADPDEWDDLGNPASLGTFAAFLSTPAISLAGIDANTVTLAFNSSWRPEVNQTATVEVSYDGAAPVEILRFESNGANIHPDNTNESVVVPMNNPAGASEMVITFGLFDAGNNWWWAIDNILVTTDAVAICPRQLTSEVDTASGTVTLNWLAAANLPGASIEVLRDGTVIEQLPLDAVTYTDTPPGTDVPTAVVFDYQVRVVGGDNNCAPLDLTVLYKLGKPVLLAEWFLDENAGVVANNNLGPEYQGQFFVGPTLGAVPAGPGEEPIWVETEFLGAGVEWPGAGLPGDGYFDLGDTAATAGLRPELAVTVAAWVKPISFVEWAGIFNMAFDSGSQEAGYYLGTRVGDFHFAVTPDIPGTLVYLRSPGILGEWSYVVGVYDGTAIRLYINGVEANSVAASGPIRYQTTGGQVPLGGQIGVFRDDNEDIRHNGTIAYVAVWDGALSPEEIQRLYQSGLDGDLVVRPEVVITGFRPGPGAGELTISWESKSGKLYNFRSETDPSSADAIDWPIFEGNLDLVATPPENTLTFSRPGDSERFFVVEEFNAPPVSIYSDDFEAGAGAWTTGSGAGHQPGTLWEFGTPTFVDPSAPSGANSGTNCFGTNLSGTYEFDADVWLRSPPIDLTTAGGATLCFFEYKDIETSFDFGSIRVLDAADDSELAVIDSVVDGFSAWQQVKKSIPAAALGKTIRIEFRFESDNFSNLAGWYIDDVVVTVP